VSVAALAVALSMMVAIAIMIGSFRETVVQWVGQTLVADLFVGPSTRPAGARQATISPEVELIVSSHPDVAAVDRFRNVTAPYAGTQVSMIAGDFRVLLEHGNLPFKAPSDGKAAMRGAIGRDAVIVSEAFALRHGSDVGDTVTLATNAGARPFEIAAVYYDYSTDRGVISMDGATYTRHFGEWRPTGLTTYLRPGVDADAARAALLAAIGERHEVFIYTNRSLRAEVLRIFDATFAITYALEAIAIVVAVMGVAGTLLTLILERRKEIAMLRLVGADRRQVGRMVVLEAVMLGAASQGVGLAVGLLLSLVLIYVINVQSFGWTIQFHLPWVFLLQMSVVIVVCTALAGLYPARLAARMSLAGEVVEE
jgi:putative ABC transport system permease protein